MLSGDLPCCHIFAGMTNAAANHDVVLVLEAFIKRVHLVPAAHMW